MKPIDLDPSYTPPKRIDGDETITDTTPAMERYERLQKALAGLAHAGDRLERKLEVVLLPEPTHPMPPEGALARDRDVNVTSRLADQHTQVLSAVLAQASRLESLVERIDL